MKAFFVADKTQTGITNYYPFGSQRKKLVIANNMGDVIAAYPTAISVEEVEADVRILKSLVVKSDEP